MPPPEMPEEEAMALLTARDPWDGKSALDTAAILGRAEIVQYFIAKEVGLNDASTKGPCGSRLHAERDEKQPWKFVEKSSRQIGN